MKHKRFSDEQVIGVLKERDASAKVDDICRRHAISSATFYTWGKKYGGMEASDAKLVCEQNAHSEAEAEITPAGLHRSPCRSVEFRLQQKPADGEVLLVLDLLKQGIPAIEVMIHLDCDLGRCMRPRPRNFMQEE